MYSRERRHLPRIVLHGGDEFLRVQRINARIVFAGDDQRLGEIPPRRTFWYGE